MPGLVEQLALLQCKTHVLMYYCRIQAVCTTDCYVIDPDASLRILQYEPVFLEQAHIFLPSVLFEFLIVLKWQALITMLNTKKLEVREIATLVTMRYTCVNFFFTFQWYCRVFAIA